MCLVGEQRERASERARRDSHDSPATVHTLTQSAAKRKRVKHLGYSAIPAPARSFMSADQLRDELDRLLVDYLEAIELYQQARHRLESHLKSARLVRPLSPTALED